MKDVCLGSPSLFFQCHSLTGDGQTPLISKGLIHHTTCLSFLWPQKGNSSLFVVMCQCGGVGRLEKNVRALDVYFMSVFPPPLTTRRGL